MNLAAWLSGDFPVDFLELRTRADRNSPTLAWDTCRLPGFFLSLQVYPFIYTARAWTFSLFVSFEPPYTFSLAL
jgi:hypothetical protein